MKPTKSKSPAASATPETDGRRVPLVLVHGDDDFAVSQHAREIYSKWCAELGGMDHEILDASVSHSGDALAAIARLREAMQTLPFFGSGKAIWFRNCNFLGADRTSLAAAVTEALAGLAQEFKDFPWTAVRLLITAGEVDKRKVFFKTIDKLGTVEAFQGLSADDKDWMQQAELLARKAIRERGKEISGEALAELVSNVGPHVRLLNNEIEKLTLFLGDRREVEVGDVVTICTRNKSARAFALGDALGDRDLPRLLRTLDEELWEMKFDSQKSEIGVLYGLIGKVRAMILLKEMMREGWVKPESDYNRFKAQLAEAPAEKMPEDKRFNPLAINAYVMFKAIPQVHRYTQRELIDAMEALLRCNRRLISSTLDGSLILQQTLIEIVGQPAAQSRKPATR